MQKHFSNTIWISFLSLLLPLGMTSPVLAAEEEIPSIQSENKEQETETSSAHADAEADAQKSTDPDRADSVWLLTEEDPIPVDLFMGNEKTASLKIRPRLSEIRREDLKLPEGIVLADESQSWKVPEDGILRLECTSSYASTSLQVNFIQDDQNIGSQQLTRKLPGDDQNQVVFNFADLKLPEGTQLQDPSVLTEDMNCLCEYGSSKTIDLQVVPAPDEVKMDTVFEIDPAFIDPDSQTAVGNASDGTTEPDSPISFSKQIPAVKSETGTQLNVSESVPECLHLVDEQQQSISLPEDTEQKPETIRLGVNTDQALIHIVYEDQDQDSRQLATALYAVPAPEGKNVTVNLEQLDLDMPAGYSPVSDLSPVEAFGGKAVTAVLPVTGQPKKEPESAGTPGHLDSVLASTDPDILAKNEDTSKPVEIIYKDPDGKVVGKQVLSSNVRTITKDILQVPASYKLGDDFKELPVPGLAESKIEVTVQADDPAGTKKATFKITYKDPDGQSIGTQTVTKKGTSGSATLQESDLVLPDGYSINGNYTAPSCSYGSSVTVEIKVKQKRASTSKEDNKTPDSTDPSASSSKNDTDSSKSPSSSSSQEAVLKVIYYTKTGSDRKTVKTEEFKSDNKGEKGKEYIFEKGKTYTVKAPVGYSLTDESIPGKVSVDYGYSGTLEVQVKPNNVSTSAQSGQEGFIAMFAGSALGLAAIFSVRRKEDREISHPSK